MSMEVLRPTGQSFAPDCAVYGLSNTDQGGARKGESSVAADYGGITNKSSQVSFGGQPQPSPNAKAADNFGPSQDDNLMSIVSDLVQQLSQLLIRWMNQNQSGGADSFKGSPSQKVDGSSDPGQSHVTNTDASLDAPANKKSAVANPALTHEAPPTNTVPSGESEGPNKADAISKVGEGQTVGQGPYLLNITNTQDHPIKIGQFDQKENKVAELSLEPGQSGIMKYPSDTTTLIKQADKDGQYRPDASRLEAYNGFINTSDIDGRNAAIHAVDGKGFEIGDKKSIADNAVKAGLIKSPDETIKGWYDGSTAEMKKAGEFLEKELGTGDTYIHPNDDQFGQGKNPMRHTDSMSLDVEFGKA